MSYKILDAMKDGENAVTVVEFYGVKGNGQVDKNSKVTLNVTHYKPSSEKEIYDNLDEMVVTSQPPKEKDKDQEEITVDVVSELKKKLG